MDLAVHTVGTKEVVLRGGPPSLNGVRSDKKVSQILGYYYIAFTYRIHDFQSWAPLPI